MIIALIIIILIILFLCSFNSPKRKGAKGENQVASVLQELNANDYFVINNLLIKNEQGITSQIDHLVVSIYGLFVIETKNYQGWIFGNEKSENWTEVIYKKKIKFRNPIKQNWAHIYALRYILKNFSEIKYFPIIVFTGGELKAIESKKPVIYTRDLLSVIYSEKKIYCSREQINKITNVLLLNKIDEKNAEKEHIIKIKANIALKKERERNLICPRCGNKLVLRNGPYGSFYGCSKYPYCKYKQKKK